MLKIEETAVEQECRAALDRMREILNGCRAQLALTYGRDVILGVYDRIKSSDSIEEKLKKKGYRPDLDNAVKRLNDIAGIRVVCRSLPDIYLIREELRRREDLTVLKEKDFVRRPKKSGYRSLHMIVKVPLENASGRKNQRVEIQIRTAAMHRWAEIEHETHYKKHRFCGG